MIREAQGISTGLTTANSGSSAWAWAAAGTVVLASCGHLLIKAGVMKVTERMPEGGTLLHVLHFVAEPHVLLGLSIYAVSTLLGIYAVSQKNISFLYPITALNYVAVALGGRFWFGEEAPGGRWLGIVIVVAGVALMQLSARGEKQ